jgi:hypothetical protein
MGARSHASCLAMNAMRTRLLPMCAREAATRAIRVRTRVAYAAPLLHRHQKVQDEGTILVRGGDAHAASIVD